MTIGEDIKVDLLSQNYREMNETGKEKLKQVAGQVLDIWKTVNEDNAEKTESRKELTIV